MFEEPKTSDKNLIMLSNTKHQGPLKKVVMKRDYINPACIKRDVNVASNPEDKNIK